MSFDVVYAMGTETVNLPSGGSMPVGKGTHWPVDDPVVRARPDLFSRDPRWGLLYTQEPDGYNDPIRTEDTVVEMASSAPGEKRPRRTVQF